MCVWHRPAGPCPTLSGSLTLAHACPRAALHRPVPLHPPRTVFCRRWPDAESRPRRLDARIFGHVAAVVQLANTCDSARSLLHGCDHLCALYDRIRTSFFGHENTEWQHEGTCSRPNAFGQEPPEPGDWFFDKSFQPPAKAPMGVSSAKPTDPSATPRRAATTRSVIRPDLLRHRLSSAEHARRRRNLTAIAVAVGSLSVYLMISLVTADHEDLALPDDD